MTRVLVVGVARSGTSWVATMLASTESATLLSEPDDALLHPFAARAKRGLPGRQYPVLSCGDDAHDYEVLWKDAFGSRGARYTPLERIRRGAARRLLASVDEEAVWKAWHTEGGPATPVVRATEALAVPERPACLSRNLIVKSVTSALSVEWIAARTEARVVVILRDVRNVVSSWLELGWIGARARHPPTPYDRPDEWLSDRRLRETLRLRLGAPPVPEDGHPFERLAWLLALLTSALEVAAREQADWEIVRHEALCAEPQKGFRALAESLGLVWTDHSSKMLAATNQPGRKLEMNRIASQPPTAWRSRLTAEQCAKIEAVLEGFPLVYRPST